MSFFWNDPFFSDPWAEMRRMRREMDKLFQVASQQQNQARLTDGSNPDSSSSSALSTQFSAAPWRPVCDVKENDKDIVVHAELPGVKKEDIQVELHNGFLTISGERNEEKKEQGERYHRVERSYGKFARSVAVPEGVSEEQIKARYENGVLEVTMPKPQPTKPEPKRITVS